MEEKDLTMVNDEEIEETSEVEETPKRSGLGLGASVGVFGTLMTIIVGKRLKKAYDNRKAKKESAKEVTEDVLEEVEDAPAEIVVTPEPPAEEAKPKKK